MFYFTWCFNLLSEVRSQDQELRGSCVNEVGLTLRAGRVEEVEPRLEREAGYYKHQINQLYSAWWETPAECHHTLHHHHTVTIIITVACKCTSVSRICGGKCCWCRSLVLWIMLELILTLINHKTVPAQQQVVPTKYFCSKLFN